MPAQLDQFARHSIFSGATNCYATQKRSRIARNQTAHDTEYVGQPLANCFDIKESCTRSLVGLYIRMHSYVLVIITAWQPDRPERSNAKARKVW